MDYLQYRKIKYIFSSFFVFNVLNLVINGLPSIPNTCSGAREIRGLVLNLVINGLPSILSKAQANNKNVADVLNLVINGLPSIL